MLNETIETRGHTTKDGTLNLSIKVDAADADVAVIVQVRGVTPEDRVDTNGWPSDFFERVAGSMPDLQRPSQGTFEDRIGFELSFFRYQRVHYVSETARRSSGTANSRHLTKTLL